MGTQKRLRGRYPALRSAWQAHIPHEAGVEPYYDWLVHVGSLTARLRQRCSAFRVQVLRQGLALPYADEARLLRLRAGELAWARDVLLLCGGSPVVYAHSVLPQASVRGGWHLFAGLGTRPLGAILFSDPLVRRMPFAFRRLDGRHPLYHRAAEAAGPDLPALWARRSVFERRAKPILLTEIFLPRILKLQP